MTVHWCPVICQWPSVITPTQISHFVNEFIVRPVLTSSDDRIWQFLPRPNTHLDLPSITVTKNSWPWMGDHSYSVTKRCRWQTRRISTRKFLVLIQVVERKATQYLSHFHISSKLDWDDNIRKIMGLNWMLTKSINQISLKSRRFTSYELRTWVWAWVRGSQTTSARSGKPP